MTVLGNMKGTTTIEFLVKDATISCASYYKMFKKNSFCLLNDLCVCVYIYIYIYSLK